ncbi:MAG: hypothetical protein ACFFC7_34190 [Candidatus Hermodarchaeota archaeon]
MVEDTENVDEILNKKMMDEMDEDPAIVQRWQVIADCKEILLNKLPKEVLIDLLVEVLLELTPEEKQEVSSKLLMKEMLAPVAQVFQGAYYKNENGERMVDLAKMKENYDKNPFFQKLDSKIKEAMKKKESEDSES